MYITLQSTAGLQLDFELPPEGWSIINHTSSPGDFVYLLIEQGKRSEDERSISLVVRGTACHHESDAGFRCEMMRRMEELCLRLDSLPLEIPVTSQHGRQ